MHPLRNAGSRSGMPRPLPCHTDTSYGTGDPFPAPLITLGKRSANRPAVPVAHFVCYDYRRRGTRYPLKRGGGCETGDEHVAEAPPPGDGNLFPAGAAPASPHAPFGSCPFLGLWDDRASHATFATPRHRCHARKRPQPIEAGHQATYCLGTFTRCPAYASATPQAAAVRPLAKPGPPVVPAPVAPAPTNSPVPPFGPPAVVPPAMPQRERPMFAPARTSARRVASGTWRLVRDWLWLALLVALLCGVLADLLGATRVPLGSLPGLVLTVTFSALMLVLLILYLTSAFRRHR